jgi:hypothetical protein
MCDDYIISLNHFTKITNLPSILASGYLYGVVDLSRKNIKWEGGQQEAFDRTEITGQEFPGVFLTPKTKENYVNIVVIRTKWLFLNSQLFY